MTTPAPTNPNVAGESAPQTDGEMFAEANQKSGIELISEAYSTTPKPKAVDQDTENKIISADDLLSMPQEMWEPMLEIYGKIHSTCLETGMSVSLDDPEWKYVQAELDNTNGSLARTLIAAENAAEKKKERIQQELRTRSAVSFFEEAYKPTAQVLQGRKK